MTPAAISVIVVKEDADPPSQPSQTISQHLAWQPVRGDHGYWNDAEAPVIRDGDPLTLPPSEATDSWFHSQLPDQ